MASAHLTGQSPAKLARPDRPSAYMEMTNYRRRLVKERAVAPRTPEGGDHMLLPFARERERQMDERARCGPNPDPWFGRTRMTAGPTETVSTLFLDSEVRRMHAQRRAEFGTLKRQLLDERAKRKEMQRSVSELVMATRREMAAQRAPEPEPAMTRSQSSLELPPQRTVLMDALAVKGRRDRARDASPPRIAPLPIKLGGTGLGLYSPEKPPVSIWELHPAAQARAEVKQIERARMRRSYGLRVDASFFDPRRSP